MFAWKPLQKLFIASMVGITYGTKHYCQVAHCDDEKEGKYHAWNKTWKRHHVNKTTPLWDPGKPTTATRFLDEFKPILTNNNKAPFKILIPLCGASFDMQYIQNYFESNYNDMDIQIIGIELCVDAIESFLERVIDHNDVYCIEYHNNIPVYRYKNYFLIQSDIFNQSLKDMKLLENINCIYDKESLSALTPSKWNLYINLCKSMLIDEYGKILLTAWRYDTNKRDIIQRYTSPYSFGYENIDDVSNLYESLLCGNANNITLLYSEAWDKSIDKNYYKLKGEHLGICGKPRTDIWLLRNTQLDN